MHLSYAVGLPFPPDFNGDLYDHLVKRICENHPAEQQPARGQILDGLKGVFFRYSACCEHDTAFTNSVVQHGDAPAMEERYLQEKHLFGFFVTGLSAIECSAYACYWLGSLVEPSQFKFTDADTLRNVNLNSTAKAFARPDGKLAKGPLTSVLQELCDSPEYENWKDIRNILAHRAHPGRNFFVGIGGNTQDHTEWINGIGISAGTTSPRRKWLASKLGRLLEATDAFVDSYAAQLTSARS